MSLLNRFVLFFAVTTIPSGLLLIALGVQQLEIYYAVYLIEFLVSVELIASVKQNMERFLRPVVIAFLFGFFYSVAQRVLQILS